MFYKYKYDGGIIIVHRFPDINYVEVEGGKTHFNDTPKDIEEDEKDKFFTMPKGKIYLDDWIKTSMKELKERIQKGDFVVSEDLCKAIMSDGVDDVRFINEDGILCKVKEIPNRELERNYKIRLAPVESKEDIASKFDYYTGDFLGLIKKGFVKIMTDENDKEDK